jgi:hypothetical protein
VPLNVYRLCCEKLLKLSTFPYLFPGEHVKVARVLMFACGILVHQLFSLLNLFQTSGSCLMPLLLDTWHHQAEYYSLGGAVCQKRQGPTTSAVCCTDVSVWTVNELAVRCTVEDKLEQGGIKGKLHRHCHRFTRGSHEYWSADICCHRKSTWRGVYSSKHKALVSTPAISLNM